MFVNSIIYLLLAFIIQIIDKGFSLCISKSKTCSECIRSSADCFWCADPVFNDDLRCNSKSRLQQFKCSPNYIMRVSNEAKPVRNEPFSPNINSQTINKTIQLMPQRYSISLRPKSWRVIPIHFKQAADYPIDLYYLMDLSCTMIAHKSNLAKVGEDIARKMGQTTSNFRIGFGSFVDKTVMPFTNYEIKREQMCQNETGEHPYSFYNRMSLNSNARAFVESVKKASVSGNVDSPEGTLDALMQVIVCRDEINWRQQADKIIVVATDEEFHYAGDGKLGGILLPNDGKCHMKNNSYTHSHLYDYPSMHQIAEKVRQNRFNVLFSVDQKIESVYKTLAQIIGTNARTGLLDSLDDQSVTRLIESVYKEIRSSVELKIDGIPRNVSVELWSNCSTQKYQQRSKCDKFNRTDVITFDVNISLVECPNDRSQWNQVFPIGLTNNDETVEIELKMLCECECERSAVETNSSRCSGEGTYACGKCSLCNRNRFGDRCECDLDRPVDLNDPDSLCRKKGDSFSCSNRGECYCGKCKCKHNFSGKYCECDDWPCFENELQCSQSGKCQCGRCECDTGYNGTLCQCPQAVHTCIAPNSTNNQICSDKGECRCGQCRCRGTSSGKYCHKCPTCESKQLCDQIQSCVPEICVNENCTQTCQLFANYSIVDTLEDKSDLVQLNLIQRCQQSVNDCVSIFSYERIDSADDDALPALVISRARTVCSRSADPITVSISVISSIILAGLALLLIWKLVTEILDRREFVKFQREIDKANWDQSTNPLYKEAKTTFTNPTFGLSKKRKSML